MFQLQARDHAQGLQRENSWAAFNAEGVPRMFKADRIACEQSQDDEEQVKEERRRMFVFN